MKTLPSLVVRLAILLGIVAILPVPAGWAGVLQAGVARIDITPRQPVVLSGYASRTNLSQGVHDPLSARAVAFEQDGKRLLLISVENVGFYQDTAEPLRQPILDACRLQPSELLLCAIHTHSAPTLTFATENEPPSNVAYTKELQKKLADVARTAFERLAAVRLGVGTGYSPVGANRRETIRDNAGRTKIVLGRNPTARTDREVQVLKLVDADRGALRGVVFAYATHSTSLGPRNYLVSGDIHGLAAQFLERYLGEGVVTTAFAGASGNIDPWYRVLPGFNTTNGWIPEPVLLGTLLGEEVAHVLPTIQTFSTDSPIRTAMKTIDVPGKPGDDAPSTAAGQPAHFILTVASLGDLALVGLGGEVFDQIGEAIKAASPFPHTFILTHCNAAGGYLPTRDSYPEEGYEVRSSPFGPGADERVIEETTRMLRELRKH